MTDPIPQFSHFVQSLADAHPSLGYLHVIEPDTPTKSNDFLREIWAPRPFISTGRHNRESAIARSDKSGDLVAFGRWYISNVCGSLFVMKKASFQRSFLARFTNEVDEEHSFNTLQQRYILCSCQIRKHRKRLYRLSFRK